MNRAISRSYQNGSLPKEVVVGASVDYSSRAASRSFQENRKDFHVYYKQPDFLSLSENDKLAFMDELNQAREKDETLDFSSWNKRNNLDAYFNKKDDIQIIIPQKIQNKDTHQDDENYFGMN
jgi:lipopolysaccharide export LptBFGC system permease protein LptF